MIINFILIDLVNDIVYAQYKEVIEKTALPTGYFLILQLDHCINGFITILPIVISGYIIVWLLANFHLSEEHPVSRWQHQLLRMNLCCAF
jgi:hypothetical protein